jgi:hypothetical protein
VYSRSYALTITWANTQGVSGQMFDKHILVAKYLEELDYNKTTVVFSMWSVPRYYEQDRLKQRVHLLGGGQSSMA